METAGAWAGEFAYRLAGGSRTADSFPNAPQINMDHHVMELLKRKGIKNVCTTEQYRAAVDKNLVQKDNEESNLTDDVASGLCTRS